MDDLDEKESLLISYALGDLIGVEKARVEKWLEEDELLKVMYSEIKVSIEAITEENFSGKPVVLSVDRLSTLENHILTNPKEALRSESRSDILKRFMRPSLGLSVLLAGTLSVFLFVRLPDSMQSEKMAKLEGVEADTELALPADGRTIRNEPITLSRPKRPLLVPKKSMKPNVVAGYDSTRVIAPKGAIVYEKNIGSARNRQQKIALSPRAKGNGSGAGSNFGFVSGGRSQVAARRSAKGAGEYSSKNTAKFERSSSGTYAATKIVRRGTRKLPNESAFNKRARATIYRCMNSGILMGASYSLKIFNVESSRPMKLLSKPNIPQVQRHCILRFFNKQKIEGIQKFTIHIAK